MRFLLAILAAYLGVVTAARAELPWSFQPLKTHELPAVKDESWARGRIDRFLLAKMEEAGIAPAAAADNRVLARRLYLDLTGLLPTPEQAAAFDPAKMPAIVDTLLASPQYGERWGRYWLDLARYADQTDSWLENTDNAWLYRDWVVNAMNADMPYPEFVKRQLATDLMPETGPEDTPALGFLGLSPTYFKELQLPPEIIGVTVAEEWEEHIDAVGRTFLGLTLACARCHDHKTDPVTAADYYGLAGVFASTRMTKVPTLPEPVWAPVRVAMTKVASLEKKRDDLKKAKPKPADLDAQIAAMEKEMMTIKESTPNYHVPMANAVDDAALFVELKGDGKGTLLNFQPGKARDLPLHMRGDPNTPGDTVPRRFLSAFPAANGQPRPLVRGSGRLDLAEAIVEDAAPLAARVIVNRVWTLHFGRGLVATPSEFGPSGELPSHPELLDDLTARFVAHGWSLKWLHREILLSSAWQQSSSAPAAEAKDPLNKLVSRMPRKRLDIEAWRDAMLTVSGTLDLTPGGKSQSLEDTANRRRTIYGTVHRRELTQFLNQNDFPDPNGHSPTRNQTTTPLQQLFTLNGPLIQQQAAAFSARLAKESPTASPEARVKRAYALLYQREPTTREAALAVEFLSRAKDQAVAWNQYCQVLLGSNETLFVD